MAASMLDVKAIQQGHILVRRNVCKLCARNCSTERALTENKVEDTKPTSYSKPGKRYEWKPTFLKGSQVPIWKTAYEKLQIKQPNVKVPTIQHRGVELPRKVKRDPTTVLKALAETTQLDDPSAPYSFVDDVALQHVKFKYENLGAKEDGKKTARYMMSMYEKAFTQYKAEPDIPAFNPVSIAYDDTSLSVNALEERIHKRRVAHALEIYDRLGEQDEEVPVEVEEKLLELLCVFNGEDPKEKVAFKVERYIAPGTKEEKEEIQWKGKKADQIFQKHVDAGTVTAYMYNVYVCGLIKHSIYNSPAGEKALKLYEKMKEEKIPVYLCTYNSMLKYPAVRKEIFREIKKEGLVPDKETFHRAAQWFKGNDMKKVLGEMKVAGLDYDFEMMLGVFYGFPKGLESTEALIDYMAEQKTWYLDHPGKNIIVEMSRYLCSINSPEALPALRKLYKLRKDMGVRYKCIDSEYNDKFFQGYLYFMLDNGPFEEFRQVYRDVVPVYLRRIPVRQILKRIETEKPPGDFLIHLYEDVFNFLPMNLLKMEMNLKNVDSVFEAMLADYHSPELNKQFAEVAHVFFTEFVQQQLLAARSTTDQKALLTYPAVVTSLDLMLKEPSYLDKAWDCYMAYAEECNKHFRKQTFSWKKIFEQLIEAEDKMKIRQFLRKVKTSSSWANHGFLKDLKGPLEAILDAEDRGTLEYILEDK